MSSMSISESKKAISQAERVGKLTFLAFIFVPLSFTASFFGMNVKEFGESTSLWWWAAFSVPLLSSALVILFFNFTWPAKSTYLTIRNFLTRVYEGGTLV
jgi:Mg2+ and Co2+ transporter CorA